MGVDTRDQRRLRYYRLVSGGLVVAAVSFFGWDLLQPHGHEPSGALGAVPSALTGVVLVACRRWPVPVLCVDAALALFVIVVGGPVVPSVPVVAVAAYVVMSLEGRRRSWLVCAGVAMVLGGARLVQDVDAWRDALNAALVIGLAGALGRIARNRRQRIAEFEERVRDAEHMREEEARRRVAEERLRIARELHDVVGHHIALITVQAEVATHVLASQPVQAREALSHVRQASRTVLEEISVLLGVLHQPDENEAAPTEPAPTLARLDSLVASFRTAGMVVAVAWDGPEVALPTAVDLAAYRIVQEALTNIAKHAAGASTSVTLVQEPGELLVEVRNESATATPGTIGGDGRGIAGMRARVGAVGGRLATGATPDGGFLVSAVLPVPEGEQADDQSRAGRRPGADPRGVPGVDRLRTGPVGGG
ncbi:sensor histidine kinase [Actinophytocola sediminis]